MQCTCLRWSELVHGILVQFHLHVKGAQVLCRSYLWIRSVCSSPCPCAGGSCAQLGLAVMGMRTRAVSISIPACTIPQEMMSSDSSQAKSSLPITALVFSWLQCGHVFRPAWPSCHCWWEWPMELSSHYSLAQEGKISP